MSNFGCIAKFTSKQGKQTELFEALSKLIKPTRAEEGCISYDLYKDAHEPSILTMIEIFKSRADFDFHGSQEYLIQFKEKIGAFVDTVDIKFFSPYDTL